MKSSLIIIGAAMVVSAPLAAEQTPTAPELSNANEAQNLRSSLTVTKADAAPARPAQIARPDDKSQKPNWRRINHKINKRAKNAVKNGASPTRIRKKVQAYKLSVYRRWNASQ